ncbi:MAG: serine/threonine-protein kinase, partial [Rudaea sp.]
MNRQRVAELFEQAVDLPAGERAAWVNAACGDDAALRVELERLLRADARATDFMERPPALVSAAIDASVGSGEELHFGPWRSLRQIGIGGMGEVWLAVRSDGEFEQRVAIKQIAYPTPGLLQRFRQERQILARLEHPNIARLIDGGVTESGAPYLVMEYVDGIPITLYASQQHLDLRARLQLFLHVCDAVQYAHQHLVVHRDLKPSNILVTTDGTPKLLDFGIAKVLATTDGAAQTQTAARMLTPDYAAPEQFSGGAITTATDVYALGVVLHELLAGVRPAPASQRSARANAVPPAQTLPPSAAIGRTTDDAA